MADAISEPTTAAEMFFRLRLTRVKSWVAMPRPMPMIGPMSGEISMAPIITATLSVLRPSEAMNMAKINVSSWLPLNETPERMLVSMSACGSRSPLTLK